MSTHWYFNFFSTFHATHKWLPSVWFIYCSWRRKTRKYFEKRKKFVPRCMNVDELGEFKKMCGFLWKNWKNMYFWLLCQQFDCDWFTVSFKPAIEGPSIEASTVFLNVFFKLFYCSSRTVEVRNHQEIQGCHSFNFVDYIGASSERNFFH